MISRISQGKSICFMVSNAFGIDHIFLMLGFSSYSAKVNIHAREVLSSFSPISPLQGFLKETIAQAILKTSSKEITPRTVTLLQKQFINYAITTKKTNDTTD